MTIFQIEDSRPFLIHNGLPVQWHTGSAPWWKGTSRMVRINKRGIAFKPHTWHTRTDIKSIPEWTHEACFPSAFGLCSTQSSVMFPSGQTPVVNEALDWICSSTATHRSVTNISRYDASACDILDAQIDFVLADEVLFRSGSINLPEWIYWTVCVMVVYLVRCLSKYVLASLNKKNNKRNGKGNDDSDMSHNPSHNPSHDANKSSKCNETGAKSESSHSKNNSINNSRNNAKDDSKNNSKDNSISNNDQYPNPILCVSACAFTCILVISQGDFVYVTEEELLFHRFTLFYVVAYALIFVGNRLVHSLQLQWRNSRKSNSAWNDPPFYNLLAGVMQLVASRLYCGAETPYNPPIIFIVAVRLAVKSRRGNIITNILNTNDTIADFQLFQPRSVIHHVDILRNLTLLLDAFMLSLVCILGFSPDSQYLIALFAAANAAADTLV